MSQTTVPKRLFSVATRAQAHMKRGSQAQSSPIATAFKLNDNDEDDDTPRRFTPDHPDKPNLMSLHKRWHKMDAIETEEVILYLDDRSRADWRDLQDDEKKAMWYVNYGPWGPRSPQPDDPGKMYGHLGKLLGVLIASVTGYKAYEWTTQNNDKNE